MTLQPARNLASPGQNFSAKPERLTLFMMQEIQLNFLGSVRARSRALMLSTAAFGLLFLSGAMKAQTKDAEVLELAGAYFASAILADEFSKTPCGKTASIKAFYTDVPAALADIRYILSKDKSIDQSEVDKAFSATAEASVRAQIRSIVDRNWNSAQCDAAKSKYIPLIEQTQHKWALTGLR